MIKDVPQNYFAKFAKDDNAKPHVIKFYSVSCHICDEIKKDYEKLAKDLSNEYKFVKVNIDKEEKLSDLFSPDGVPPIVVYKDNNFHEIEYPNEGYTYKYLKEVLTKEE